jgi:hypothetical protein
VKSHQSSSDPQTTVGSVTVDGTWRVADSQPVIVQTSAGAVSGTQTTLEPASAQPDATCNITVTNTPPYMSFGDAYSYATIKVGSGCDAGKYTATHTLKENIYVPGVGPEWRTYDTDTVHTYPGNPAEPSYASAVCPTTNPGTWRSTMTYTEYEQDALECSNQ